MERPPALARIDCQQDSVLIRIPADSLGHTVDSFVTAASMPLVARIANLPEYHDCQRFIVPVGPRADSVRGKYTYGPLVSIWAADSLGSRLPETPLKQVLATPVAVIYDADEEVGYDSLGIAPGFNCLYVWNDGKWQAAVVPLGVEPAPCDQPVELASRTLAAGKRLTVRAVPPPDGLTPKDIPEVARWDWDPKHSWQLIGIRCANAWCTMGPSDFTTPDGLRAVPITPSQFASVLDPMPGAANPKGTPGEQARVLAVKGWYDQQAMDLRDANGRPVWTDIVGTAIPHPALERVPESVYNDHTWVPVAYLHVSGDYSGDIPLKQGLSSMWLCNGSAAECGVGTPPPTCAKNYPASTGLWWTRIVDPSGAATFRCIVRRAHHGRAIPAAAARWNWNELDAKTWIKCGGACCTGN